MGYGQAQTPEALAALAARMAEAEQTLREQVMPALKDKLYADLIQGDPESSELDGLIRIRMGTLTKAAGGEYWQTIQKGWIDQRDLALRVHDVDAVRDGVGDRLQALRLTGQRLLACGDLVGHLVETDGQCGDLVAAPERRDARVVVGKARLLLAMPERPACSSASAVLAARPPILIETMSFPGPFKRLSPRALSVSP